MNNYIYIDVGLLKSIVDSESKKLCGIIMKRYEIIEDKEILKREIKELIYEGYRNVRDILLTHGKTDKAIELDFKKPEK